MDRHSAGRTLVITLCVIVISFFMRFLFVYLAENHNLPHALIPVSNWLILFFIFILPRVSIYSSLACTEAFTMYMIMHRYDGGKDPLAATIAHLVFAVMLTEVFKRTYNKLRLQKARADEAITQKNVFLAKMSHELRTPITGLRGMVNLLHDLNLADEQRKYVGMIDESVSTLQYIIDDLLDLSKVELGKLTIQISSFELHSYIEAVLHCFKEAAHKKKIELVYTKSSSLPAYICSDSQRIKQILSNLLSNAIKYTPQGGRVELALACEKKEKSDSKAILNFSVIDNGVGIDNIEHEEIFHSFYRSIDTYHTQISGMGLGLYIVKRIVKMMGGTIELESSRGKGSTFLVSLPVEICEAQAETSESITPSAIRNELTILLVEDNMINRFFLKTLLEKWGHYVITAEDGNAALNYFKEKRFDIVLMDIQMPVFSGFDAAKEMRAFEKAKGKAAIPLVAITAYTGENEHRKIVESGFDQILMKPVDTAKLAAIIDDL